MAFVYANQGQRCISVSRGNGVFGGNLIHDALPSFLIYLGIQLENDKSDGNCHVPVILRLRCSVAWIPI